MESQITDAYNELKDTIAVENIETSYDKAIARTDMRQIVTFMAGQAKNRSYYIPMDISGETTMVHLTIKQGDEAEKGRIAVYTETEEGKVSVLMYKKEEGYETLAATDSEAIKDKLQQLCGTEAKVVRADRITDGMWNDTAVANSGREEVSYGELVRQAKSFIHNVLKRI